MLQHFYELCMHSIARTCDFLCQYSWSCRSHRFVIYIVYIYYILQISKHCKNKRNMYYFSASTCEYWVVALVRLILGVGVGVACRFTTGCCPHCGSTCWRQANRKKTWTFEHNTHGHVCVTDCDQCTSSYSIIVYTQTYNYNCIQNIHIWHLCGRIS